MHARTLPASRGWAWIIEGFALWKRNPALITFLVFGYWLCLLVLAAVLPPCPPPVDTRLGS